MGRKAAALATGFVATDGAAGNSTGHICTIDEYAAAFAIAGVVADGAVFDFKLAGLAADIQAAAGSRSGSVCSVIAALVVGDLAALYDEVACATRVHTAATAVTSSFICVVADLAAVHGEISDIRVIVFHPYATAASRAFSYARVVADLAAVHGERAATHQHAAAVVVADRAAVHGEDGVVYYINAISTVKAAIIFFAVGNNALPLPAAVAVAEDKRS